MIKFTSDTTKVMKKLQVVVPTALEQIHKFVEKKMNEFVKELVRYVEEQQGSWAALSPGWQKYKALHGLDPRILIATGGYLRSIKLKVEGNKFQIVAEGHEDIAKYLEFGTSKMPARPHWTIIELQIRYTLATMTRAYVNKISIDK